MGRFRLCDVLELPSLHATSNVVYFSDMTDQDKLELAHMRTGHVSESVVIAGFRHGLFTGTRLDWKDDVATEEEMMVTLSLNRARSPSTDACSGACGVLLQSTPSTRTPQATLEPGYSSEDTTPASIVREGC